MKRPATMSQEIVLTVLLVAATIAASYGLAGLLRRPARAMRKDIDKVPVAWEIRLKENIRRYIENDASVIRDRVVTSAVDTIRSRLLAYENDTTYRIEILVIESKTVNAVTFPGGLIVVFTPLIRLTSSPEELAAVIAHEIGHVVHRDPLRHMAKEIGLSTVLSMVNGGKAPPMIETMVKDFLGMQYTRQQESAADDYALALLAKAHINPASFAAFMRKLAPDTLSEKSSSFEYLSTHPDVHGRIEKAMGAGKDFKPALEEKLKIDWKAVKRSLPSLFD
ncbi:MAG: M48 family metallopeptidase [Chitinispirillaceae bacterium]|nr:M48 family metallopeptidase [Chitinispirillaceae bacterium]